MLLFCMRNRQIYGLSKGMATNLVKNNLLMINTQLLLLKRVIFFDNHGREHKS